MAAGVAEGAGVHADSEEVPRVPAHEPSSSSSGPRRARPSSADVHMKEDQGEKRVRFDEPGPSGSEVAKKARIFMALAALSTDLEGPTYSDLVDAVESMHDGDEKAWTKDLGWVPKQDLQSARDREIEKLKEFGTHTEVDAEKAIGSEIIVCASWRSGKKMADSDPGV